MILIQTTKDGKAYDWSIEGHVGKDKKGEYVRIGSWVANFWFHVALGKTDKLTLSYAKKYLRHKCPNSTFKYVEE